jgi:MOSC domain-containing protein YiiM
MSGKIIALARRAESRMPMEELPVAVLSPEVGVLGDCKGRKYPDSQVTILALEDWQEALADLAGPAGPPALPWTARRANVLVRGIALPRGVGSILQLGDCLVQVMRETTPCNRMNDAWPGLLRALAPDGRGGVTCKVLTGGGVSLGDPVLIVKETAEKKKVFLPG